MIVLTSCCLQLSSTTSILRLIFIVFIFARRHNTNACTIEGSLWDSKVSASTCKFAVKLSDRLALCWPENPYKWPLEFSHLSCQKCSKGFHHPATKLISLHSHKTNRKTNLTVGAELSTNNASRLQGPDPKSRKCPTGNFQGSLVGRAGWKPSSMWGERERTFGLCFSAYRWPPLKCQSRQVSQCSKDNSEPFF